MEANGTVIPLPPPDPTTTTKAVSWTDFTPPERNIGWASAPITGLPAVSTHVCVMGSFRGAFRNLNTVGMSDFQGAYQQYQSPNGYGDPPAPQGHIICAAWSNFIGPPNAIAWITGEIGDRIDTKYNDSLWLNAWGGNSITAINAIKGTLQGFGERVTVFQSTAASVATPAEFHTEAGGGFFGGSAVIGGSVRSVFLGVPNLPTLVRLIGYQGGAYGIGNAFSADTQFQVSTQSGYSSFWLATPDQALCYFTEVSGDFREFEEVRISATGGRWLLSSAAGRINSGTARASARCMAYDQR